MLSVNPDPEAIDFMGIVAGTLLAAKWEWESAPLNMPRIGPLQAAIWYRSGLTIALPPEHTPELMKAAAALDSALEEEGFKVETGAVPTTISGNPNAIHILIGSKPLN